MNDALKGAIRARKVATALVAALIGALAYGLSAIAFHDRPAFALSANEGFTVRSTVYSSYRSGSCKGAATAKLYPGRRRCLAVTVHDQLSVPIEVTALTMAVPSFTHTSSNPHTTPPCTTTMVRIPTLSVGAFTVGAGAATTIDRPFRLKTKGTQDACEGGTFKFSFSGSATYTDTTTTSLAATPTGPTKAVLKATVAPDSPSSDPYGPASATAPVHAVTFYSCGSTSSCNSKSMLGTTTLSTATSTAKVGVATYEVSGLSPGTHYYQAQYRASGTRTGTFAGSTSAVESVSLSSTKALHTNTPTGIAFTSGSSSGSSGTGSAGTLAFTGADIAAMVTAGVLLLGLGGLLVVWERRRHRSPASGRATS